MQDRQGLVAPAELHELESLTAAVLTPGEQRVVREAIENQGRLDMLTGFIAGLDFARMDEADRWLLYRQHAAMTELAFVLAARIQRFRPVGADSEGGEV
jgi:hypothetical protein